MNCCLLEKNHNLNEMQQTSPVQQHELSSLVKPMSIVKSDCIYTSCYCEENVWKLCDLIRTSFPSHLANCNVIFISNSQQTIPLWCQSAGNPSKDYLAVWDYHVIMIERCSSSSGVSYVYDLDSTLSFPCPFDEYSSCTFRSDEILRVELHRMFRVISASDYLAKFASDRSRMKKEDGSWLKPPPSYSCIRTRSSENNLEQFIVMNKKNGDEDVHSDGHSDEYGCVMGLKDLICSFGSKLVGDDEKEEITL